MDDLADIDLLLALDYTGEQGDAKTLEHHDTNNETTTAASVSLPVAVDADAMHDGAKLPPVTIGASSSRSHEQLPAQGTQHDNHAKSRSKTPHFAGAVNKLAAPAATSARIPAADEEQFSGLRIRNRLVSSQELRMTLYDRPFHRISALSSACAAALQTASAPGARVHAPWHTIGVVASVRVSAAPDKAESTPGVQSAPKEHVTWTLSDYHSTILCFVSGAAAACVRAWKAGSIVLLSHPVVLPASRKGSYAMAVSEPAHVCMLGTSPVFAVCAAKRNDGQACSMVIDKSVSEFCKFHMSREYADMMKHALAGRPDVTGNAARIVVSDGKGGVSAPEMMKGRSVSGTGNVFSMPPTHLATDGSHVAAATHFAPTAYCLDEDGYGYTGADRGTKPSTEVAKQLSIHSRNPVALYFATRNNTSAKSGSLEPRKAPAATRPSRGQLMAASAKPSTKPPAALHGGLASGSRAAVRPPLALPGASIPSSRIMEGAPTRRTDASTDTANSAADIQDRPPPLIALHGSRESSDPLGDILPDATTVAVNTGKRRGDESLSAPASKVARRSEDASSKVADSSRMTFAERNAAARLHATAEIAKAWKATKGRSGPDGNTKPADVVAAKLVADTPAKASLTATEMRAALAERSIHQQDAEAEALIERGTKLEKMAEQLRSVTTKRVRQYHCKECDITSTRDPLLCRRDGHTVSCKEREMHMFACKNCGHRKMHPSPTCLEQCPNCRRWEWESTSAFAVAPFVDPLESLGKTGATGDEVENSLRFGGRI